MLFLRCAARLKRYKCERIIIQLFCIKIHFDFFYEQNEKAFSKTERLFSFYYIFTVRFVSLSVAFSSTYTANLPLQKEMRSFLKSANLGMDIFFNIKYNISIKNYQIILARLSQKAKDDIRQKYEFHFKGSQSVFTHGAKVGVGRQQNVRDKPYYESTRKAGGGRRHRAC